MTVDRLELAYRHAAKFSSQCLGLFLIMTLLVACSSVSVFAQEELALGRAIVSATDAPLFRLPLSKGIPIEKNFLHPQGGESDEGEEEGEHRNELALILAGTYESSEEENYFTIGAEYKYHFHPKIGIMGVIEYVSGPDAWVLVFPVTFHPKGGLEILAGPGVELEPRRGSDEDGESEDDETGVQEDSGTDNLFLFRIGVAYSFEFGERYSITPGLELDFINEEDEVTKALVYGVSFGISF